MLSRSTRPLSEQDYLRSEAESAVRHEYVGGEVFAMTGGSLRHKTRHLRPTPCRVFMNDVRVRVSRTNAYYYPDLVVSRATNGRPIDLGATTIDDALLVAEVLSPGTEAVDRREKMLAYRTLPSLAEYVLVASDSVRIEIDRRQGDVGWERIEYAGEEDITLASVEFTLPMRDIYDGVPFDGLARHPGP